MTVLIASLDVGWDIPVLIMAEVAGGHQILSNNVPTLCFYRVPWRFGCGSDSTLCYMSELKQPDLSANGCKPGHQCVHHSGPVILVIGVLLGCYCVLLSNEQEISLWQEENRSFSHGPLVHHIRPRDESRSECAALC